MMACLISVIVGSLCFPIYSVVVCYFSEHSGSSQGSAATHHKGGVCTWYATESQDAVGHLFSLLKGGCL